MEEDRRARACPASARRPDRRDGRRGRADDGPDLGLRLRRTRRPAGPATLARPRDRPDQGADRGQAPHGLAVRPDHQGPPPAGRPPRRLPVPAPDPHRRADPQAAGVPPPRRRGGRTAAGRRA
ncbi:hypothetical protein D5H75_26720 [Bailinhaonella thermotolerans]|uniref:Uncharacterized protein n=1 Tax=Bailinhaonella thermotolerans TaxID=1070861 RepID=A0A3A4AD30_9ACTN|nr:hypothetical protein D5H75_26720 [Bailinhaonella thermotolerans]